MVAADPSRPAVLKRDNALARRPPAIVAAPRRTADTGRCAGLTNAVQPRRPVSSADGGDCVGWTLAVAAVSGAPDLSICRICRGLLPDSRAPRAAGRYLGKRIPPCS